MTPSPLTRRSLLTRAAVAGAVVAGGAQLLDSPSAAAAGSRPRPDGGDVLTFVLVPGAWAGGWVWNRTARELEALGHAAIAPTLPGMSPGDDPGSFHLADTTRFLVQEINRRDLRNVVLVAHDWSGYPVTAASHQVAARLAGVIYWSAFVPAAGESLIDTIPDSDAAALTGAAKAAGGQSVLVPYPRWQNRFVQTMDENLRQLTYAHLHTEPWTYLTESLGAAQARTPDVPSAYLASSQDLALPFGDEWWADKYAPRLGVQPVFMDAAHAAYFTDPVLLAQTLVAVATGLA